LAERGVEVANRALDRRLVLDRHAVRRGLKIDAGPTLLELAHAFLVVDKLSENGADVVIDLVSGFGRQSGHGRPSLLMAPRDRPPVSVAADEEPAFAGVQHQGRDDAAADDEAARSGARHRDRVPPGPDATDLVQEAC